jgi:hypothetical protein
MQLNEITFKKLYAQITYNLKKIYRRANSTFTLASPFGQILSVITELFQLNMLYTQQVQRSFDLNDPSNQNEKTIRGLVRVGQYNPARGSSAGGSIKVNLKAGVDVNEEIKGGKIIFRNRSKIKNQKNNLNYVLDLIQDDLTFTLSNNVPVVLNVIQGQWEKQTMTGTGEQNQSFVVSVKPGKEIDNYRFNLYVNSELWVAKKHKFDMLPNEKAYVPYTSFSGGVDLMFGNGDEGAIPPLGSIIQFEYLLTDGQSGNLVDSQLNEFKFIDLPHDMYGEDVEVDEFFDVDINTNVTFGSDGESVDRLKSILPYASSNFLLAGPDQYVFFLKRLGLFSIVSVFTSKQNGHDIVNDIYRLAKANTDLLKKYDSEDNASSIIPIIKANLKEITLLRKSLLTESGDNMVNIFLIPDIRVFYGAEQDTNYFNIDPARFILTEDEKRRILNYLSSESIQVISNEVTIIDPVVRRYVVNVTVRIYDDAVENNVINAIIDKSAEYFISEMRRDRIPPSDLVRIFDTMNEVDSVNVEFMSEQNENYHKEFLIKSEQFQRKNSRAPLPHEIIMSDGKKYNEDMSIGLDPILGDIIIEKDELPIIRGGFTDRYNNFYNVEPGYGQFSSVNVLILPEKTKRRHVS